MDEFLDTDMPQPLSRVKPDATIYIKATNLSPDLCALITRAITAWAYADHLFASMLATFLKADFAVASAMYQALTGGEAKRAAFLAAAKAANPDSVPLILATLKALKASRNERHVFAHHVWAHSPDVPNSLILIDPAVLIEQDFAVREKAAKGEFQPKLTRVGNRIKFELPPVPAHDRNRMMVWRERDLKEAAEAAEEAREAVLLLLKACSPIHPDDQARQTLLSAPLIQREFERLTLESGQSTPTPQPVQTGKA